MFSKNSNGTPNVVFSSLEVVVVRVVKSFSGWTVHYAKRDNLNSTSCFEIRDQTTRGNAGSYEYRVFWQ